MGALEMQQESQAKEYGRPPNAGDSKGAGSALGLPERRAALVTPRFGSHRKRTQASKPFKRLSPVRR